MWSDRHPGQVGWWAEEPTPQIVRLWLLKSAPLPAVVLVVAGYGDAAELAGPGPTTGPTAGPSAGPATRNTRRVLPWTVCGFPS